MHDHRRLGRELGLFDTDPLMGAGLPYWLPDGAVVRHELEEYVRELERSAGYRHVYSPVLGKRELYEISGHWSHYSDDMFPPMKLGAEEVVLRPSLCPHHALIYRSRSHSYRELPLRIAELGAMYRSELSGVLGGLTRVRAIQLNDAHIFCTLDQAVEEAREALALITRAYADLGIRASRHRLSLPGEGGKYVADPALWRRATALLREVLDESGIAYEAAEGEAAFYGPKIDINVTDALGRKWQCATIQLDWNAPERFDLTYVGEDNHKHRPVVIHRAIFGSFERFIAMLIEHYAGGFPLWLAPIQARAVVVSDTQEPFAREVQAKMKARGLRSDLDVSKDKLGAKIRRAQLEKIPYMLVVGDKEVAAGTVAPRLRDGTQLPPMSLDALCDRLVDEAKLPL